jgi:hypothetical protein
MWVRRSLHLGLAAPTALLFLVAVGCANEGEAIASDPPRSYATLQEMADVLGCTDIEDIGPPLLSDYDAEMGYCTAEGMLVRLLVYPTASDMDAGRENFLASCEPLVSIGGGDVHYATGHQWLLTPGVMNASHDESTIAGMATRLGGEQHTLDCV